MLKPISFLLCSLISISSWASVDPGIHGTGLFDYRTSLPPEVAYERTQAVLKHFGVPEEPDYGSYFTDLQGKSALRDIRAAWKSMDMGVAFSDFTALPGLDAISGLFSVFQDPLGREVADYSVALSSSNYNQQERLPFELHFIRAAADNPGSQPLLGLKIALDPGHMGGDYWDGITGKFVKDASGHKLSEGIMNLQIALLMEQSLTALGAEVMLTHRTTDPVTTVPYDTFDLHDYALLALRESTLDGWFQHLIEVAPVGDALYEAFQNSADFKALFAEQKRWDYFVQGYDLDARAQKINAFSPDLSIIIHLDANDAASASSGLNSGIDGTKMYVPGAFDVDEVVSREDRMYLGRHLLDAQTHQASIGLSSAIAQAIHSKMGIAFDGPFPGHSLEIGDGVQTRNLDVQRKLITHPSVYFEGLYYNDPKEFAALSETTYPMTIGGQSYPYSERLKELQEALLSAVVSFVRSYSAE